MITIKIPIQNKIDITNYLREFNSCMRFSYNRFVDGLNEKDIRHLIKNKKLFTSIDSWFIQCSIKEAQSWFMKVPSGKIVFGGKRNFKLRSENQITKLQIKELRMFPLCIQGEKIAKGNRKFELDVIENNRIIFKPKLGIRLYIDLPQLRKNRKKDLFLLEELSKRKELTFTIRLSNSHIYIIFDEKVLRSKQNIELNKNRILGLDLNPNYIGWSILEFDSTNDFKVLNNGVIENKELNKKLNVPSTSPKQIYQNNKKMFEIFEISKFLVKKCLHFQCSRFSIEKLQISAKNHQMGRSFNRLVNNCWNRNSLISNLKKRCNIFGIDFIEVNAAYSSFVGNMNHGQKYPDMIASSIEIARRGFHKWQKNWFYPILINNQDLLNRWKEAKDFSYKSWKELFNVIKTSKLNYRSSINDFTFIVFSLNNIKSKVKLYCFP